MNIKKIIKKKDIIKIIGGYKGVVMEEIKKIK